VAVGEETAQKGKSVQPCGFYRFPHHIWFN